MADDNEALRNRIDELEEMIFGLCNYLAYQADYNAWPPIDTKDESVLRRLRSLPRERRLEQGGAARGFFAAVAIATIQNVRKEIQDAR